MSNKLKDIDTQNQTFYFFNDSANVKICQSNNIEIDEKSYKNIVIYYIEYVTTEGFKYVKLNSVKSLYLILCKLNAYLKK